MECNFELVSSIISEQNSENIINTASIFISEISGIVKDVMSAHCTNLWSNNTEEELFW